MAGARRAACRRRTSRGPPAWQVVRMPTNQLRRSLQRASARGARVRAAATLPVTMRRSRGVLWSVSPGHGASSPPWPVTGPTAIVSAVAAADPGNLGDLADGRRPQPLHRAEVLEQRLPAGRPEAGDLVQRARRHRLGPLAAVVGDGEAVRLVADPLEQVEALAGARAGSPGRRRRAARPPPAAWPGRTRTSSMPSSSSAAAAAGDLRLARRRRRPAAAGRRTCAAGRSPGRCPATSARSRLARRPATAARPAATASRVDSASARRARRRLPLAERSLRIARTVADHLVHRATSSSGGLELRSGGTRSCGPGRPRRPPCEATTSLPWRWEMS